MFFVSHRRGFRKGAAFAFGKSYFLWYKYREATNDVPMFYEARSICRQEEEEWEARWAGSS